MQSQHLHLLVFIVELPQERKSNQLIEPQLECRLDDDHAAVQVACLKKSYQSLLAVDFLKPVDSTSVIEFWAIHLHSSSYCVDRDISDDRSHFGNGSAH